ncbi:MFS transporter [Cellulomonas hominis]|uniref:MFS transporter n=1 Tax=Cellulomonas hominis TaxID=156981 RepID=UPI001B8FDEE6|nr:MFS transporter [Cellulomonas hominis]VTR75889.1 Purine efflux pump PbuE [Cellulomonas hominis]
MTAGVADPAVAVVGPAPRARLWPLATGTFAIGFGSYVMAGLVPTVSADLGISVSQVGTLVSVYGFTYAISTPLLTLLVRRVPRQVLMGTALALFALAAVGTALATTPTAVAVLRALSAVAAGGFTPTATVLAARLAPPGGSGRAVATVFGGLTTATVLGAPAGNLLGPLLGYRGVYALVAGLAVVALVSVLTLVRAGADARARGADPHGGSGASGPGPGRAAVGLVAIALAVSSLETAGAMMVQTYASPLLTETAGIAGVLLSGVLLAYGVAGVAGNVAGGWLADRYGPGRSITIALTASTLALVLLAPAAASPVTVIAVFSLWGFAAWAMNSPLQNVLLSLSGRHGQLVVALNSSVISLGTGLGALLGGWVIGGPGYGTLGIVAAGVTFAAVLLTLVLGRRDPITRTAAS